MACLYQHHNASKCPKMTMVKNKNEAELGTETNFSVIKHRYGYPRYLGTKQENIFSLSNVTQYGLCKLYGWMHKITMSLHHFLSEPEMIRRRLSVAKVIGRPPLRSCWP